MAATWDQKPVPEYSAAPPAQLPTPTPQTPLQYQQTGSPQQQQHQQQYFVQDPNAQQNPQMAQTTQGNPQQPQAAYMQHPQQSPNGHPQQQIPMQQIGHPGQVQSPLSHPGQMQQPGQQRQFQNATPLASLGRSAAPVDCPACGQRSMTKISYLTGNYTHGWAVGLCCLTWFFCWVPYVVDGFKNVDHNCGQCGVLLATWHRSGGVDVHQHL